MWSSHSTQEDVYRKRWKLGSVTQPETKWVICFPSCTELIHTLKDTAMEWFSDFYSTNISSALNTCQATHLALFQRCLIQVSNFVDERSEFERVKRLVEGYRGSKRHSWNLEWSLPIPCPGILCAFGLQNRNNFHVLACDFYCFFIHPVAHNTVWGHKRAITNCWRAMAIYLSTFWEGTTVRSDYFAACVASCAKRSTVGCRWVNLSSHILTVFLTTVSGQLFQCSARNQNELFISFDS